MYVNKQTDGNMEIQPWVCPRCHYETHKTSAVKDHLTQRNKPCSCKFSTEDRNAILDAFVNRKFRCRFCKHAYSGQKCLLKHENVCSLKETLSDMQSTIQQMTEKIHNLEQINLDTQSQSRNTTINNNTTTNNININININNFGSESREHITNEIWQQCLEQLRVNALVESVYFNPDHPENHTIKLKSEKKKRVLLHQDGKWVEGDMNSSIDTIMHRENSALSKYFYEQIWPDDTVNFDNKAWTHEKLTRINDKNKSYFDQRRTIQAKLKNDVSDFVIP